jgi:glyoxylase-like metal-dependent hydrolase (beta-lactamase superfamily II)
MAQLKLEQIGDSTRLIRGLVNIGVFIRGGRALLIDSGNDKEAGRQINKLIAEQGWTLECIVNTHSNADHIGGNAFLQKKTGCRIAATSAEAPFIRRPELEAAFLYGGFPYPGLDNKFLRAAPSEVTDSIGSSGPIRLSGNAGGGDTGLEAIPLPGHYFEMIGVRTPDNAVFIADSLFSETIIRKYNLFFIYDIAAYLATLDTLASLEADWYIPSHAPPSRDITNLIHINREKVTEICEVVASSCTPPARFDSILERVCARYSIVLDPNQFVLVSSTLRSYLSYLAYEGRVTAEWEKGAMIWKGID